MAEWMLGVVAWFLLVTVFAASVWIARGMKLLLTGEDCDLWEEVSD